MGCAHGLADRAAATSGAAGTGTGHTVAYQAAHLSRLRPPQLVEGVHCAALSWLLRPQGRRT